MMINCHLLIAYYGALDYSAKQAYTTDCGELQMPIPRLDTGQMEAQQGGKQSVHLQG